jgi:hypothetical protein
VSDPSLVGQPVERALTWERGLETIGLKPPTPAVQGMSATQVALRADPVSAGG